MLVPQSISKICKERSYKREEKEWMTSRWLHDIRIVFKMDTFAYNTSYHVCSNADGLTYILYTTSPV